MGATLTLEQCTDSQISGILARDRSWDIFIDPPTVLRDNEATLRLPVIAGSDVAGAVPLWGFPALRRGAGSVLLVSGVDRPVERAKIALDQEDRSGRYRWRELAGLAALVGLDELPQLASRLCWDGPPDLMARRYLALVEVLQDAVDAGAVDMVTAEGLAQATSDPESVARILNLAGHVSFSNRRQMIKLFCQVARRESLTGLLAEMERIPPAERLPRLFTRRYPRLTAMRAQVERVQREVLRGTGVRLAEPPNFEGQRFRVSFEVGSTQELEQRQAGLDRLKGELDALLGILFEDPEADSLDTAPGGE